jgi:hypothetical protein
MPMEKILLELDLKPSSNPLESESLRLAGTFFISPRRENPLLFLFSFSSPLVFFLGLGVSMLNDSLHFVRL